MIVLTIPGEPMAQPRQRHGIVAGKVRNWTPSRHPVNEYKAAIRLAWQAAGGELSDGPVMMHVRLVFPRPKSMVWKKRPMRREWHTKKPDCDNVLKAIKDGLKGLAFRDDSQVWRVVVEKWIADGTEQPSTTIEIEALKH